MSRIVCLTVFILLALPLGMGGGARALLELPTGSVWTSDYHEVFSGSVLVYGHVFPVGVHLSIDGTQVIECNGLADLVDSGGNPALEYTTTIRGNVSGTASYWSPFGPTIQLGAEGSFRVTEHDYYNLTSGLVMRSVYDQLIDVESISGTDHRSLLYYSEHNDTIYTTQQLSSFGKQIEPGYANLVPGDNWSLLSEGKCNSSGVDQSSMFDVVADVDATLSYTYLGPETIEVPAGNFTCKMIRGIGEGFVMTVWYNADVDSDVKAESTYGNDTATTELRSYTLKKQLVDLEEQPALNLEHLMLGVAAAIASVFVIPLTYNWMKSRNQ